MNEYYELLGVSEDATDEQIKERYEELKAKYKEERWQDGEAGNEAAKMLTKLDVAYAEIQELRKEKKKNTQGDDAFAEIADLLKQDRISDAQSRLDDFNERSAEWHYLQAVVYYKKNWTNDSKKQLEIAIEMDPNNAKYRAAYGKMCAKEDFERQSAEAQNPYSNRPINDNQMGGRNTCSECISCCYTYLCIDCLFSLCCGCR